MLNLSVWLSTKLSIQPVSNRRNRGASVFSNLLILNRLPNHFDRIPAKLLIASDHSQTLGRCLCDQHPVEWIFVKIRQAREDRNVSRSNGEDVAAQHFSGSGPPIHWVGD